MTNSKMAIGFFPRRQRKMKGIKRKYVWQRPVCSVEASLDKEFRK